NQQSTTPTTTPRSRTYLQTSTNQAGLLSSMTPEQLLRNSVQGGLANMSWDEFSGSMTSCCGKYDGIAAAVQRSGFNRVGPNLAKTRGPNPGVQYVPTTGTILVLNFGEVIQLTEEYYAPGSLGTFNLQLTVQ
ncbi:MAG: major capsid protein V20 domain-containing protein, partial [Candidatus Fonsibacter sp.]